MRQSWNTKPNVLESPLENEFPDSPGFVGVDAKTCAQLEYQNKTNLNIIPNTTTLNPDDQEKLKLALGKLFIESEAKIPPVNTVSAYNYNSSKNMVAYITGNIYGDNDDILEVHIYFFDTKENRLLYSLQNKNVNDEDYVYRLSDVGFSQDGTLLAITTTEDLFIYNLETKTLISEFKKPKEKGYGGAWSYGNPQFSLDKTKLLLTAGYYEGTGSILFDLQKKQFIPFPRTDSDSPGIEYVTWYEDNLIALVDNGTEQTVIQTSIPDFKQTVVVPLDGYAYGGIVRANFLYIHQQKNFPSGEYECNNISKKYEVETVLDSVVRINLVSGKIQKLLETDATRTSGAESGTQIIQIGIAPLNGENKLFVKLNREDSYTKVYQIDETKENTLLEYTI